MVELYIYSRRSGNRVGRTKLMKKDWPRVTLSQGAHPNTKLQTLLSSTNHDRSCCMTMISGARINPQDISRTTLRDSDSSGVRGTAEVLDSVI